MRKREGKNDIKVFFFAFLFSFHRMTSQDAFFIDCLKVINIIAKKFRSDVVVVVVVVVAVVVVAVVVVAVVAVVVLVFPIVRKIV